MQHSNLNGSVLKLIQKMDAHAINISDNVRAGVGILFYVSHAKQPNRIINVSGRVFAFDFTVHGKRIWSIAAYVPHWGYSF